MHKLYAVRDVKSESYGPPMQAPKDGIAIRGFGEGCSDPRSDLNKYPTDYMLYELGEYDPNSGQIMPLSTPRFIISATEVLNNLKAARAVNEPLLPTIVDHDGTLVNKPAVEVK